ncbi:P-loop containing nucleoside triphosphate hydrolase protein [Syncephalis pseudoplumigaleata]|uniref:P-loop containing nucleoside triphosphate hydrolase protein n=1 Tax=Syncephalis pseudoplumigaleata TaxID=1712513 RepID=A0A4V1J2D7_9FUNG|nr:P-loop containing nucleoside triphosphate hydrolase protein [Syncephalis pseudoplumigaleata]|eukprot:RKP28199.1 P-loop containing nucleoside triphosphate hydrolase protein [Syncephalis pseudoplumigaleata]
MSSASKQKRNAKKAAKAASKTADAGVQKITAAVARTKLNVDLTCTGVLTSEPRSRDIKIESFTMSYFGNELIQNATIELNFNRRYGLIGANGSGKSTFLKAMADREVPIPEHIDVYLLREEAPPTNMTPLRYVVKSAEDEVARLEQQIEQLLGEDDGADNPLLDDLYERIESMDAATFESRAATLLHGLGFDKAFMAKNTEDLSGGWRMRVALAKALFVRPTLLLLDEPTNHLDLEACVWLEEYLKTYDRILVLVSHSQDFLNGVCTNTINLTHQRKLVYYGGNYDTYVKTRAENEVNQMKAYEKQQAEIEHIKKFIASAGTYANLVRQAKSKQKIIDKMEAEGLVQKVEPPPSYKFRFNETTKLPPPVLSFENVYFAYSGRMQDCLYRGINLGVDMDSRVALVGPNGAGKSTLLKLMMGEVDSTDGRVQRHSHLKLAKYSQHSNDQLNMSQTPIEYMRLKFPQMALDTDGWRRQLGRFGVSGARQTSPIGHLSDGIKSRIVFAEIALTNPSIILLDEPTNHLDIESIDSLADAINHYEGGVVLVSHDFRLIGQVAKNIWVCENGQVTEWKKSIEEYKETLRKNVKL